MVTIKLTKREAYFLKIYADIQIKALKEHYELNLNLAALMKIKNVDHENFLYAANSYLAHHACFEKLLKQINKQLDFEGWDK